MNCPVCEAQMLAMNVVCQSAQAPNPTTTGGFTTRVFADHWVEVQYLCGGDSCDSEVVAYVTTANDLQRIAEKIQGRYVRERAIAAISHLVR